MAKNSLRALAALSLSLVLGLARAQDSNSYDPDPPDRAARLSYLSGDVSMQPAGEDEWTAAMLNRPLTTGDKLWTERGARAEIYVGPASVRLGDSTGFSFLNVDDDTIQMRMTAGVLYVNVSELDGNDHVEIDTPNVAVSVLRPGSYRVEVNDAGDATTVKISEGEAEIDGPGQNVVVHAQQVATFRGDDRLTADWGSLGSPDDFDRWNLERDRRDQRVASSRTSEYVAPDVTGYQDLDDNGSWSSEPEYGYVWTPRVVAGWSPYRDGRWVWVSPWGWTWIDDAPWGYAPFHYGRWAHVRDRWCWVPGPRHVRAVYAPALVGWVGSPGLHVSVNIGSGVGWFPLGPREVYVPGRRFSRHYVERVNVSNTVIVNRTYINEVYVNGGRNVDYRNRHVPGGFTAVSRDTFVNARRTGDPHSRIDERDFARANVSGSPQLQPGRESRLGGPTRVNVRVPPRTVVDRQVIVKRDPPAANARWARARGNEDVASRPTERFQRPAERPQDRDTRQQRNEGNRDDVVVDRNRNDRPGRVNTQPGAQPNTQPVTQQNGSEQRSFQPRQREDRPPKQRDERGDDRSFERARENRQQEQQAETQQRWQRNNDQQREQQQRQMQDAREQQQRQQQQERQQDQNRERFQRQAEDRQAEARQHQQQEQRQQQERRQAEPRQSRPEPRQQNDKPRQAPKDQDSPKPNRD